MSPAPEIIVIFAFPSAPSRLLPLFSSPDFSSSLSSLVLTTHSHVIPGRKLPFTENYPLLCRRRCCCFLEPQLNQAAVAVGRKRYNTEGGENDRKGDEGKNGRLSTCIWQIT